MITWVLIFCNGCGESDSIELCIAKDGSIKSQLPEKWVNDEDSNMILCKDCVRREQCCE